MDGLNSSSVFQSRLSFSKILETVSRSSLTIDIIFTRVPQFFFSSLKKSKYFFNLFAFFNSYSVIRQSGKIHKMTS